MVIDMRVTERFKEWVWPPAGEGRTYGEWRQRHPRYVFWSGLIRALMLFATAILIAYGIVYR